MTTHAQTHLHSERAAKLIALAMIVVVLTQITYLTLKSEVVTGKLIWGVEAFAFSAIAVLALLQLERGSASALVPPLAWASLSLFGLVNLFQVGIGLTMFGPLGDAGEVLGPVMGAVLAFAFFLYFTGKVLVGVAAIAIGLPLLKADSGAAQLIGGVCALAGLAALALNATGMVMGMDVVTAAGAAGTAATLFVAIALLIMPYSANT